MFSVKNNFIYIWIPKCAGSSLSSVVKNYIDKPHVGTTHENLQSYQKNFRDSAFKFTFVRNPWDRIFSTYNFYLGQGPGHMYYKYDKPKVDFIKNNKLSFEEYVNLTLGGEECSHFVNNCMRGDIHLKPIIGYFCREKGDFDFVGKFENINEDFKEVSKRLNWKELEIPHKNKSNRGDYKEHYNEKLIQMVYSRYKKDIESFDYQF